MQTYNSATKHILPYCALN